MTNHPIAPPLTSSILPVHRDPHRPTRPNQAKQHAVTTATDALIGQGLPAVLMRRVEWVTREVKCRGRSPLEVELEVERQKAAGCLFFLFYQVRGGRIPLSLFLTH